jgi:hypothetical protein
MEASRSHTKKNSVYIVDDDFFSFLFAVFCTTNQRRAQQSKEEN